ncbi:MAG: DUF2970 domain-containing protein [Proteobacteria bacterium]|nr:DUF2970 domain-containing protein [Pseudomonadota bacterium]
MTDQEKKTDAEEPKQSGSINPLHVVGSVFAAGLGVQSSKNRERDFKQGNFKVFVITGIVFTLLFIGAVFAIVQMVLKSAGA